MNLRAWTAGWILSCLTAPSATCSDELPVWIEESHAGSFYFFVETLRLSEPHTLVLFDAHSDANGVPKSDRIREAIRRGPTFERRREMLDEWRQQGRIQCFDWIEPLMPLPFTEVVWVAAERLNDAERERLEIDAREYLDAHEEGLPRDAGPLAPRYRVMDRDQFRAESMTWPETQRIAASVDLDYFASWKDEDLAAGVDGVVRDLLKLRGLRALSFAISTPYLRDLKQAEDLTAAALDAAWRIGNAEVRFEPFAFTGPDRSLMAKLRERKGEVLPALDWESPAHRLRSLLAHQWNTDEIRHDAEKAVRLMGRWLADPFLPRIEVPGHVKRTDGTWGLEAGDETAFTLSPAPVGARVRWRAIRPTETAYRVGEASLGFAHGASRWIWSERILLDEGPVSGSLELAKLSSVLDPVHQCGTVRLFAEVERDGEVWRTPVETVCVRKRGTTGVRAAWTEQFGLPYVFDSRLLRSGQLTGPECRWGADCANFITQGLRAEGWLLPWGSPSDVRPFLQPVKADALPAGEVVLLDLGNHLAGIWEDKPPLGVLNDEDECIHQLEGLPQILPWGELREGRRSVQAAVLKTPENPVRLMFAGDLMFGRDVGKGLKAGSQPLGEVAKLMASADLAVGNLECVIGDESFDPNEDRSPLKLIAPVEALAELQRSGIDAVSLCNNHALDDGPEGLERTMRLLNDAGIQTLGSSVISAGRLRIGLIGLDDSKEPDPEPLLERVKEMTAKSDLLIVMPHWGREHTTLPTRRQEHLAGRLLQSGVDLIVGSGPHAVQPLMHTSFGSVAFSLGNTVFNGPGPDLHWSRGGLLEVVIDSATKRPVRMKLHDISIEDDGSVHLPTQERF